ncbi:hypothetical protein Tco_0178022 [Tanacetum coccineum]
MRLTNSQYGVFTLSTYAVSMKITIRRYSKSSKLGMISKIYYERSAHSKESSPIRRIDLAGYGTYTAYSDQLNTAYLSSDTATVCMTRSSTRELLSPFENPKQKFHSKRRLFDTPSLVESNSPEFDHNFDILEQPEEEGQFLKELRDNTFSSSEHEDANEHIEKEVILFYNGLDVPTPQILDSNGAIPSKTAADAKIAIQEMAEVAGPRFYHRNNGNSSYPDQRPSLEESLTKFMAELAKRHEENSNIIKKNRASTNAAIRNQGSSIKTLEIQTGQMSKVLQERGFGSLPRSTETNSRDQVKSISTAKSNFSRICHIGCGLYVVSGTQHMSILYETVLFPNQLQNFSCDDWREAQDVKIVDAYVTPCLQKKKSQGALLYLVLFIISVSIKLLLT